MERIEGPCWRILAGVRDEAAVGRQRGMASPSQGAVKIGHWCAFTGQSQKPGAPSLVAVGRLDARRAPREA